MKLFTKKWGFNSLLSLISIILMLVVSELVLRKIYPPKLVNGVDALMPHPTLGWSKKPGASFVNKLPEDNTQVKVTYNSQGWRDVEHQQQKPDKVFRILVLGDSFMEGVAVSLENIFSRRLEKLAQDAGYNIEVISMANGAYGTLQEYFIYEESGQRYSPNLVLLGFHAMNDVQNNGFNLHRKIGTKKSVRPFLDPNSSKDWDIIPVDFKRSQKQVMASQKGNKKNNKKLGKELALVRLIRTALSTPKRLKDNGLLEWLGASYCEEPKEYSSAWSATERIIKKLKNKIEIKDSQLLIFSVPALVEVDLDYMQATISRIDHPERLCLEQAPHAARLNQILTRLGVQLIDLLPDFRKANREQDTKLFMLSDRHWNEAGHSLAAERVFSAIVKRRLLRSSKKGY